MVVPAGEVVSVLDARLAGLEINRKMIDQAAAQGRLRGDPGRARALVVTPGAVSTPRRCRSRP